MEKYRVFISSTIQDLRSARDSAEQVLKDLEIFEPRRVENLPAIDQPSRVVCYEEVRNADAIVLLIGTRYGFIPPEQNPEGLSVTHMEYREARKRKKHVFAFVLRDTGREEAVETFISEVEGFERGLFRKEWNTNKELAKEVQRALLFWVARFARLGIVDEFSKKLIIHHLDSEGLRELPLTIENLIEPKEAASAWIDGVVNRLKESSDENILPRPSTSGGAPTDDVWLSLRLSMAESSSNYEVDLRLPVRPPPEISELLEEDKKKGIDCTFSIEVSSTDQGADALWLILNALLFALAEEPQSAEMLVEASYHTAVSERSREQVIFAAALLDIRQRAESALGIAKRALELEQVSGPTITAVTMDLFLASMRASVHGSRLVRHKADGLHAKLLIRGIEQGVLQVEALYSIAKMLLSRAPRLALRVYTELLSVAPQYDERWYWHRDVGRLYYSIHEYENASASYDKAARLKADDSELFRFAGDAYYHQGRWVRALERYERALAIEPTESYFLDFKIEYARTRIRSREDKDRLLKYKRALAWGFSSAGSSLAKWGFWKLAKVPFLLAARICVLDYEAARWLALFANRKGQYAEAIYWLKMCLSCVPEDAYSRLNLVVNMIFSQKGKWTDSVKRHAKAALFHAGPAIKERFKVALVNTSTREELIKEFDATVEETRAEWEQRKRRRLVVLKPQQFGPITHFELP